MSDPITKEIEELTKKVSDSWKREEQVREAMREAAQKREESERK